MANKEHLAILKQGVEVWNLWRDENPSICPDFSGASLGREKLSRANLSYASLSGANLIEAFLSRANLSYANLFGASLSGASLIWTNLHGASLRRALLNEANFRHVDLSEANLTRANMYQTTLADIDLGRTLGLDEVEHRGPSTIGIDTLYKSGGNIPESFLRGCGVPEQFIEYARSLVGKAIEYYSCFISYSSKDEECAQRLYESLQTNNVRCWFAPEHIKTGDDIRVTIDETVRSYDKLLLICSEASINSQWVRQEVETALERERRTKDKVLFPIRIDDAVIEDQPGWASLLRNTLHITDFTHWKDHDAYQKAFQRLLRDLKAR